MRKFIVSLILLLIAGGVVFYFGWVQFEIPANSVAVAFSKTSGWDPQPLRAGRFTWKWERLLPTNFTLYIFKTEPYATTVSASGTLPSGDLYAGYVDGTPDFSYDLELFLSYHIDPARLPALARDESLKPDGMDAWYQNVAQNIQQQAIDLIEHAFNSQQLQSRNTGGFSAIQDYLTEQLSSRFPNLVFDTITPKKVIIPDLRLYEQAREIYMTAQNSRKEAVSSAAYQSAQQQVATDSRMETLRKYGEVLSKYPVLLDYFSFAADKGVDPLNLETLRTLQQNQ